MRQGAGEEQGADCILVEQGSVMVGGCLALLHPPQCPSCPRNEFQEAARQEVRLALHIGEPAKCPVCGRGVGGAEEGL
jgi:hypothetical protein